MRPTLHQGLLLLPSTVAKHVFFCVESTQGLFFFSFFLFYPPRVCYSCHSCFHSQSNDTVFTRTVVESSRSGEAWGGAVGEATMAVLSATCHCSVPGAMLGSWRVLKTELWDGDMKGGWWKEWGRLCGIFAWGLRILICQRRATVG